MAIAGSRPGYSFLVCPDSELLKHELERMLAAHAPQSGKWERVVFWGDEEPPPRFWESLVQTGLFAASRAVVVRNAQDWPAAVWQKITRSLARGADTIWPFFCLEVGMEKGKFRVPAHIQKQACYRFAEKSKWIWTRPALAGKTLEQYVAMESRRLGIAWDTGAMSHFCSSIRPEAQLASNELAKLALLSNGSPVTSEMIATDTGNLESNAFICIRKLMAGDLAGAWQEIGNTPGNSLLFFLIALLDRELRQQWAILAGGQVRLYASEATQKKQLARRLGFSGVAAGFSALADAEWQVKSGSRTPDQAMEWLICRMAELFSS